MPSARSAFPAEPFSSIGSARTLGRGIEPGVKSRSSSGASASELAKSVGAARVGLAVAIQPL
jgi:hypothetical protein